MDVVVRGLSFPWAPVKQSISLEGYSVSVLLYGAGATGKTHTLLGPDRGLASRLFGQLVNRAAVIRPGPCPVTTGQTLAQLANN